LEAISSKIPGSTDPTACPATHSGRRGTRGGHCARARAAATQAGAALTAA